MPRKPQRSTTNAERSDEDILRQRRRMEAVQTADFVMFLLSWHLWILALIWFLGFAELVPKQGLLAGIEDGSVVLLSCGQLCGSLSRSAPNGEWPAWRKPWYLAWVVVLAILAFGFVQTSALVVGALCGLLAAAMAWACPAGPAGHTPEPKGPDAVLGRGLVILDGMAGVLLAVWQARKVSWHSGVEMLAVSITALPLLMFSLGLLLSSHGSLLTSVPTVMLHLGVAAASSASLNDWTAVAMLMVVLLAHLALYLPLPLRDPDSNPFYTSLRRGGQKFARFLAQPVSGFGEENS